MLGPATKRPPRSRLITAVAAPTPPRATRLHGRADAAPAGDTGLLDVAAVPTSPPVMTRTTYLSVFLGLIFGACDMQGAETLDYPRVLAIALDPADPVVGEAHTATALTFEVGAELEWTLCPVYWEPSDLSCPVDEVALGTGNPITFTWPELSSAWLLAKPRGDAASPAVKRLEVDAGAVNPTVTITGKDGGPAPLGVVPGAELELGATISGLTDEERGRTVVSWYVTAGELEPARTRVDESVVFKAPDTAGEVRVIVVARETLGGTAWAAATLVVGEVAP